jgi:hypothetical protein
MTDDQRRSAPATLRNRSPILDVLRPLLPETGLVLEVASGTGEHAVHFAQALPSLRWQPSDASASARRSIAAWIATEKLNNVLPPLDLDVESDPWPIGRADVVLCINMIHISPWKATEGLMRGTGRVLASGQPLYLYGPYRRSGHALEPSNAAFDADLRLRDERWGLRELDEVAACADAQDLVLERVIEMPANNLSVIFRKR